MSIPVSNLLTKRIIAVLFLSFLLSGIFISNTLAGNINPDFAFPQTVRENAETQYKVSIKEKKPVEALRAAIEMNIAESLTTPDSILPSLLRYRQLADVLRSPYSDMAKLLEARLLLDVYLSQRWQYDERVLPADDPQEDPMLWDGERFKRTIMRLCDEVLQKRKSLSSYPISRIAPLITNAEAAEMAGMSIFDFAGYRVIDLINPIQGDVFADSSAAIPFILIDHDKDNHRQSPTDEKYSHLSCLEVADMLVTAHESDARTAPEALFQARITKMRMLPGGQPRIDYAETLLQLYPLDNPDRPALLLALLKADAFPKDMERKSIKRYNLIEETVKAYPHADTTPCLNDELQSMRRPYIHVSGPEQVLPDSPSTLWCTSENMKDFYLLLVPVKPEAQFNGIRQSKLSAGNGIVTLAHITHDKPYPFGAQDSIAVPPLSAGCYAILPSATPTFSGKYPIFNSEYMPVLNVCEFTVFTTPVNNTDKPDDPSKFRVYVTDGHTGRPIRDANFKYWKNTGNGSQKGSLKVTTGQTGPDGSFLCTVPDPICEISYNGSTLKTQLYGNSNYPVYRSPLSLSILTDLALYHPGDSIQAVAIAVRNDKNLMSPAAGKKVEFTLLDANREKADEVTGTTDRYGRATATLRIPSDRLTGNYTIRACELESNSTSRAQVSVAEYKAPTFRVSVDQPVITDDILELTGAVTTYSGMPFAGSEVGINIAFNQSWWWWRSESEEVPSGFNTKVTTGADGRFNLRLGITPLLDTTYESGYFDVNATSTSESGETQSSNRVSFSIGSGFTLSVADETIEASEENIEIKARVTDILGHPVNKELSYTLQDENGKTLSEGKFLSPILSLKSADIPSGHYNLTVILADARKSYTGADKGKWLADTTKTTLTVWRQSDKRPPLDTALWCPVTSYIPGENNSSTADADILAGSSYPGSYIFYQIADCDSIISQGWLEASERNIRLNTPAPRAGNRIRVILRGIHDLNDTQTSVIVYPADIKRRLTLATHTFRDKIAPASTESWSFTLAYDGLPVSGAPALAVMSDASLNAITPFKWNFNPSSHLYFSVMGGVQSYLNSHLSFFGYVSLFSGSRKNCLPFPYPGWNTWGYKLYDYGPLARGVVDYSSDVNKFGAVKEHVVVMDAEMEVAEAPRMSAKMALRGGGAPTELKEEAVYDEADAGGSADAASDTADLNDIPLRDTSHPLAFFKPLLLSDSEGLVNIDFEVPNFNTTWALQLLAYDDELHTAYLSEQIVAAKPVMVTTNMPRFLLTGDKASIAATMFNNSDDALQLSGRIEIVDPTTGRLIAFSDSGDTLTQPSANSTFSVEFDVPADCNALVVRSIVRSGRGSDGEQDIVQVLPSSQPVLDATTFYLTPGDMDLTLKMPSMGSGDMVTLNYCANPAWFVLTSLSGLTNPESASTLANLNALYANRVGGGLIGKYPTLKQGLVSLFKDSQPDSLLTSPLEQNGSLKISTLQNTPWVNNSKSETERMAGLESLTSNEKCEEMFKAILDKLDTNRKKDGSFSWMPQMQDGSLWITLNFINCAASLKECGFYPTGHRFETMVVEALRYTDKELGKVYYKTIHEDKGKYPLTEEISYLLDRSLLTSKPTSGYISEMRQDMLKRLPQEWKKLSIYDKILAARILKREDKGKLAREIMESVKQFASYKPEKGMWFDNLGNNWYSPSSKVVTAACIMALNEIMPEDKETVMKMCQYLVLSRQTEDWNIDLSPAAVTMTANAVLGSDLGWTDMENSAPPVITLDGKPLPIPETQALTGNIYIDLIPEEASHAMLSVKREAAVPAWGGVLRQYVAPAKDVKAHSVPQLKVTKQLLPIEQATGGEKAKKASTRFSKGELVRVTLTLEADRDLDYVLINDRRGAFMQPADQLTEYTAQNGLWILRETRNTATNFYITRLPKGKYIFTYDAYADRDGEYSTGIATAQSQYYPLITAHSAGCLVTVD